VVFFLAQVQHGGGGPALERDKSPCLISFLLLWVDWLIDFFEEREKVMCQMWVDCKKCDRKKQQQGGMRGGRQKDCANPEVRGVRIFACRGLLCGAARNELSGKACPIKLFVH
ncbi:MAG: hypothetical protein ACOYMD_12555, partial [Paludibacter sp.]